MPLRYLRYIFYYYYYYYYLYLFIIQSFILICFEFSNNIFTYIHTKDEKIYRQINNNSKIFRAVDLKLKITVINFFKLKKTYIKEISYKIITYLFDVKIQLM